MTIKEFFDKYPQKSGESRLAWFRRIANLKGSTFEAVKKEYYQRYKQKTEPKTKEKKVIQQEQVDEDPGYEVVDGYYIWKTSRGNIKLSVEQADQLFYEYSEHGLNLSQNEMIRKHNFKVWEWNSIKNTLWLFKKSNIFSPYTEENTPPEQLEQMMADKMEKMFQDKGKLIEKVYNKQVTKKYREIIDKDNKRVFANEALMNELGTMLPKLERKTVKRTRKVSNPSVGLVEIADLHVGARVESLNITKDFNLDILRSLLHDAADKINAYGFDEVHLVFLGDLIESFTGLNHKNSWKSIEWGMYGARVIFEAVRILREFISMVYNVEKIYVVGGNHDRSTSDKAEDVKAEIAEIISKFLKESGLDVWFEPHVLTTEIDNIRHIFVHNAPDSSAKDLIINYGSEDKFNLISSGHIHSRKVSQDSRKYRSIVCPSIFSGNFYSEENLWTSTSGFYIIINQEGMPEVVDKPLKAEYW